MLNVGVHRGLIQNLKFNIKAKRHFRCGRRMQRNEMKFLTVEEMKKLDRTAIEKYKIPGIILMENAAFRSADIIAGILSEKRLSKILIICGIGNNGGDGFGVARHLFNKGFDVCCMVIGDKEKIKGDAGINYDIVKAMRIGFVEYGEVRFSEYEVIVDAIFGVGLCRKITGIYKNVIEEINRSEAGIVFSLDIPSGIDGDSGEILGVAVKADYTITMGCPKLAFKFDFASEYIGKYFVADISLPKNISCHTREDFGISR